MPPSGGDAIDTEALSRLNPAVPAILERIVDACLEKNPEHRPAGAERVADLLDAALARCWSTTAVAAPIEETRFAVEPATCPTMVSEGAAERAPHGVWAIAKRCTPGVARLAVGTVVLVLVLIWLSLREASGIESEGIRPADTFGEPLEQAGGPGNAPTATSSAPAAGPFSRCSIALEVRHAGGVDGLVERPCRRAATPGRSP